MNDYANRDTGMVPQHHTLPSLIRAQVPHSVLANWVGRGAAAASTPCQFAVAVRFLELQVAPLQASCITLSLLAR
jgi:hypothetical protein